MSRSRHPEWIAAAAIVVCAVAMLLVQLWQHDRVLDLQRELSAVRVQWASERVARARDESRPPVDDRAAPVDAVATLAVPAGGGVTTVAAPPEPRRPPPRTRTTAAPAHAPATIDVDCDPNTPLCGMPSE